MSAVVVLQGIETALPTSSGTSTTLGRAKLIRLVNTSDTAVLVTVESHGQASYTRTSTVNSNAVYTRGFSGNFTGNFSGNYIGGMDFMRVSTRSSSGTRSSNYVGDFTGNYVGNYVGLLVSDVRSVTIAAGEVITLRKAAEDRIFAASAVVKGVAVGFVG